MTEKKMITPSPHLSQAPSSELSRLMNDKLKLKSDEKLKNEFNNHVHILNQKEFLDASIFYQQKLNLARDMGKSKTLTKMLNKFNKMPKDDSDEYRTQVEKIKEYFQENKGITHNVNDHIKDIDIFHTKEFINKNGVDKIDKNDKNDKSKKKGIVKNKISNLSKTPVYDKLTFPFRTKEECQSRAISQPTFVKKSDMVRIMGKLGFQEKIDIPLSNLTKDDLCNLYFDIK